MTDRHNKEREIEDGGPDDVHRFATYTQNGAGILCSRESMQISAAWCPESSETHGWVRTMRRRICRMLEKLPRKTGKTNFGTVRAQIVGAKGSGLLCYVPASTSPNSGVVPLLRSIPHTFPLTTAAPRKHCPPSPFNAASPPSD